jgi:hypothetical protein
LQYDIRPLKLGEVLDQAVNLTKDHFWLLFKIMLFLLLPFNLVSNYLVNANAIQSEMRVKFEPDFQAPPVERPGAIGGPAAVQEMPKFDFFIAIMAIGAALINMLLVYPLSNAAIIYAVGNCYLNQPISVGTSYRRAVRVYLPLLGTTILMMLAIGVGYILCLVPAAIFGLWFCLSTQVVVLEGLAGTTALKRSRELMRGNMRTAFLLWVVMMVIFLSLGVIPKVIQQLAISSVVESLLQTVVFIFYSAVWVVFYFSCRAKAEHFDLTMLADAVGVGDNPPDGGVDVSPRPAI